MTTPSPSRRLILSASVATGLTTVLTGILSRSVAAAPPSKGKASMDGEWSAIYAWPDVAVHLSLLPNGKVLTFSDDDHPDYHRNGSRLADFTKAFVVDIPSGGAPSGTIAVPNTTTNMFCSGHALLPDGRLIIFGGHEGRDGFGSTDVNILGSNQDGSHYVWHLQGNSPMAGGRWYPSALTLADGGVVVVGGSNTSYSDNNTLPEVWQPSGGLRALTTARLSVPLYPRMHLGPNGRVLVTGPSPHTLYLDTTGTGRWTGGPTRQHGDRDYGCSVMYDNGKILTMGGGDPPVATAETIDLGSDSPTWRTTGSMKFARRQHNATLLADGSVLVTGGTSSGGFNNATRAVLAAELWNPATGKWTQLASMQVSRLYHATALLLPDARVLSAGGGRPAAEGGGTDNENAEIFSPPYLFKGARPVITGAPLSVGYGQTFVVNTPDAFSVAKISWIRLTSVSHGANMNQRGCFLGFKASTGGVFVDAPQDRNLSPPGHYMLFLINEKGVPSVSRIIQII